MVGNMDGKNGELENLKEKMGAEIDQPDDPHDAWDADAFKATLGESMLAPKPVTAETAPVTAAEPKSVTNEAEPKWETGTVFSIKSQNQLTGAAEANVHKKWGTFKETPHTPDIPDTPLSPDVPGTPEQEAYSKSYAEWKRTRDFYNGEIKDSKPTGVEAEFNRDYEAFLINESKGWRRLANLPRRMFGLQPKLSAELEQKAAMSRTLRERYHKNALALLSLREQLPKKGNLSDEKRKAALDRYERMLTRKLLLGVDQGRKSVQEKVALEVASRDKQSRIRSSLEALRQVNQKYKYAKWGTMVLGYGVLAGATGGVGAAAAAGSWTAARIGGAVGLGGLAGAGFRKMSQEEEVIAETKLEDARTRATTSFFDRDFSEVEAEISKLAREVEQTKALNKAGAAVVAVGAGFAGYNMAGGILDAFDVGAAPLPPETPKPTPPTESPTPPREMGDLRVMEEVQELAQSKTEVPPAVDSPPVEEPIVIEEPPEEVEVHEDRIYTVYKGDNLWNIMTHESEVIGNLPASEQNKALDTLFDYMEQNRDFAKEIGVQKSGGDIHKIYPEETINITELDTKLRELLGMNVQLPESMPVPEPRPEGSLIESSMAEVLPERSSENETLTMQGPDGREYEVQNPVSDINQLTIQDYGALIMGVDANDPGALRLLEQMGQDPDSFRDIRDTMNRIHDANPGPVDARMPLGEYLNQTQNIPPAPNSIPEVTPYGYDTPMAEPDTVIRDANATASIPEAQLQQAAQDYVKEIEKGTSGFFFNGQPSVAGTFDKLAGYTFTDIKNIATSPDLGAELATRGIDAEGWNRWVDTINKQVQVIPANDNEQLGQYVARVVSGNRTA